jgi:hypothetical protein
MVTKAIVQMAKQDATLGALAGADRIFAEIGRGDQTVVFKDNGKAHDESVKPLKASRIQILVNGWEVETGEAIANRALAVLEGLEGSKITVSNVADYEVKTVVVTDGPILVQWKNSKLFSANAVVNYIES